MTMHVELVELNADEALTVVGGARTKQTARKSVEIAKKETYAVAAVLAVRQPIKKR